MGKRSLAEARKILARNTRAFRDKRGWSQQELGQAAGLRQAFVSAVELGEANPTLESLDKLASALKVDIHQLLRPAAEPDA